MRNLPIDGSGMVAKRHRVNRVVVSSVVEEGLPPVTAIIHREGTSCNRIFALINFINGMKNPEPKPNLVIVIEIIHYFRR